MLSKILTSISYPCSPERRSVFALLALGLSSCSTAAVQRTGYTLNENNLSHKPCAAVIWGGADLTPFSHEVLGTIRARDPGMGIDCSQDQVLQIFLRDACALEADVINITEETFPDISSPCYRANAQFVRLKQRIKLKSALQYEEAVSRAARLN